MSSSTDSSLVARTLSGDTNAFGELVLRYQSSVFNVCFRLLGERRSAEDLTQEAFIRAYQHLHTFDVKREFGPWVRRVTANLCYNHLQKKHVDQVALKDEVDLPALQTNNGPEAVISDKERAEKIRATLATLPDHYRIILELRHFQEMNYKEIASELNLPINTIKSHLFRARRQLAKILYENHP